MPILLFRLNNVPEDEAEDVRALLRREGIDFYETDAGRWGISVAAIWLPEPAQLERANALIAEYQAQRLARAREAYAERVREGVQETMLRRFLRHPLRFLIYLATIALIILLMVMPFFHLR